MAATMLSDTKGGTATVGKERAMTPGTERGERLEAGEGRDGEGEESLLMHTLFKNAES